MEETLHGRESEMGEGHETLRVARDAMTLRERAADTLRRAIMEQRLPPGSHLKERVLCEMLGVSRTSVREALRHLESEHLVETIPHRGQFVVSMTVEDARDIYATRAALEGLVGELFAANATDRHRARLEAEAGRIASLAEDAPADALIGAIEAFFETLLEGAGNKTCAQMIRSLTARVAMYRRLALESARRRREMLADVDAILGAAEARDAAALRRACVAHVENACAAVLTQLRAETEGASKPRTETQNQKGDVTP